MINARVKANLIHDNDARPFHLLIQLTHSRTHIACCDYMCLAFDGRLDDGRMVGIRNQRDNKIDIGNGSFERTSGVDVKGDGGCAGKGRGKGFGRSEGAACWRWRLSVWSRVV